MGNINAYGLYRCVNAMYLWLFSAGDPANLQTIQVSDIAIQCLHNIRQAVNNAVHNAKQKLLPLKAKIIEIFSFIYIFYYYLKKNHILSGFL